MSRQLSEAKKCLIKDAGLQNMTVREAARYAGVDQRTVMHYLKEYGFKPRGYLVKVKLDHLSRGMFPPGERFKVEDLAAKLKEELGLKNNIDAKDLDGKLKWLTQYKMCAFDEQNKSYYVPMAA
jgi:hypothetical protein